MTGKYNFDTAVAQFRRVEGGKVEISDFLYASRPPYRLANLTMDSADAWTRLRELGELAVQTDGYLVMYVHTNHQCVSIMVSRELDDEEIREARRLEPRAQ